LSFNLGRHFKPYRHQHEEGYQYCGLDNIEGYELQAQKAERAFRIIDASLNSLKAKRAAFVELIESAESALPVRRLRLLHIACNFPLNPAHKNAKFMSFAFETPLVTLVGDLCGKRGVSGIWFASPASYRLFSSLDALAPYASRFKGVPF
jgi:hypothetical protein